MGGVRWEDIDWPPGAYPVANGVVRIPVRTPTLPPATHTNAYLIGERDAVLIEPATPYPDELERLLAIVAFAREQGVVVREILATHHHADHIGGARALKTALGCPLTAHALTIERAHASGFRDLAFERRLDHGMERDLGHQCLVAVHTPGHAPGHLCFFERRSKLLVAGDMVAGVGTILVEPNDGDLSLYLESLEEMIAWESRALLPAHGDVIWESEAKLREYIAHRGMRERKVLAAVEQLRAEGKTVQASSVVPIAYSDAPQAVWPLAERSVEAHLIKLQRDGHLAEYLPTRY